MASERTAAEVFGLLSDEIRLDVLRAVAVAQNEAYETGPEPLSFSEIYDRVDVENTSKLSYHLGELTGTFLQKRGEGYLFTHSGEQVVRLVLSGNYDRPEDVEPIPTAGRCLYCGESALQAVQQDQFFLVRCSACGDPVYSYRIRPAQVQSHEEAGLIDSVISEQAGDTIKLRRGVCPDCAGHLDTRILDVEADTDVDAGPVSFAIRTECGECLRVLSMPLTHAAAYHPASVAFHWEHGVDVAGKGLWELHRFLYEDRWSADRVDDDPAAARTDGDRAAFRVTFQQGTTELRCFLDDAATVTLTERVRRRE
jgi:hypothetical protein